MESGGEEHSQDHGVPGSKADSMTNTTHGAENAPFYDANVRPGGIIYGIASKS